MIVYHYQRNTKEFIGQSTAERDPLKKQPLIPAFSTPVKAPKAPVGKVAVFDSVNGTWSLLEDHRGTLYNTSTGEAVQFDKIGPIPVGLTADKPGKFDTWDAATSAWVLDITQVKNARVAQIKIEYDTALSSGTSFNGALFQTDDKSITALSETLTALANGWALPGQFAWIDAANKPHPADSAFLQGLASALADHKAALFARLQTAKTAISSATTEAAINNVVL